MDLGMKVRPYREILWGTAFDAHFPADHGANSAA